MRLIFTITISQSKILSQVARICLLLVRGITIFTARIRRMGEGNIFNLCVSSHLDRLGATPFPGLSGGYPLPRSRWWGWREGWPTPPIQVRSQDGGGGVEDGGGRAGQVP